MRTTRGRKVSAALLFAISLALALQTAAGQMNERAKRDMGLVVEPLDLILADLRTFDFKDVGPLMRLRAAVFARKDDPQARHDAEAALLKFLQGSPAPGGLMAACRALSLIGGPEAVPGLAALLLEPATTDPARYALERIPATEAGEALIAGLDKAQGDVRRGIVFSLGQRGAAGAVPALAKLAAGRDAVLAADAVKALGRIGGPEAIKALAAALGKAGPLLRSEIDSALLAAAGKALAAGDKAGAAGVYDKVFAAATVPVERQAAFKGRIAAGPDSKAAILKALAGKDAGLYAPALAMVPGSFEAAEIAEVAGLADRLPEEARVQLTALLSQYPAETVRPYLLAAAESPAPNVRLAALRSIMTAGDGKSVVFLATRAARATGAEQEAAREALARIEGSDVDAAVLEHLGKASDEAVRAELVQAASARRIAVAKPALMELVLSGPAALKARSAAALRALAGQADIPVLLDLMGGLEDETALEALQDAVAAAARTDPRELGRAGEVRARLDAEKDAAGRAGLLRILGKIGDDSALSAVRAALRDPDPAVADAAVRAVADWPTATARDDALEIARTSIVLNHRVLAIRAYVRMIGLEPARAPEGATADLLKVLALAPRAEEKRLVLGLLGRFPCVTSLKTAESLLADPEIAGEAKLAADRIRRSLK